MELALPVGGIALSVEGTVTPRGRHPDWLAWLSKLEVVVTCSPICIRGSYRQLERSSVRSLHKENVASPRGEGGMYVPYIVPACIVIVGLQALHCFFSFILKQVGIADKQACDGLRSNVVFIAERALLCCFIQNARSIED